MVEFFDAQESSNELNGKKIDDGPQLLALLSKLRHRTPFICELRGENGFKLSLGLGEASGFVQFSASDGRAPYWVAVAPGEQDISTEAGEFLIGGTATPILRRYCMDSERQNGIVVHFLRTGQRSPSVIWEEV